FINAEGERPKIFIPAHGVGTALHGDRVRVRVRTSEKGLDGKIITVIKRRNPRITGRVVGHGKRAHFEPDDLRLQTPQKLSDVALKSRHKDPVFVANIVRFPHVGQEEVIVEIESELGNYEALSTEIERVLIRESVNTEFPQAVQAQSHE